MKKFRCICKRVPDTRHYTVTLNKVYDVTSTISMISGETFHLYDDDKVYRWIGHQYFIDHFRELTIEEERNFNINELIS